MTTPTNDDICFGLPNVFYEPTELVERIPFFDADHTHTDAFPHLVFAGALNSEMASQQASTPVADPPDRFDKILLPEQLEPKGIPESAEGTLMEHSPDTSQPFQPGNVGRRQKIERTRRKPIPSQPPTVLISRPSGREEGLVSTDGLDATLSYSPLTSERTAESSGELPPRPAKRKATAEDPHGLSRQVKVACPYFKHNPAKYDITSICRTAGFAKISELK